MSDSQRNTLLPGTILRGASRSYRIERALGQGSFGITYLAATQLGGSLGSLEVMVAIKEFFMRDLNGRSHSTVTVSTKGGLYANYRRKFAREAQNLSRLKHKHIVKVLESFEANNTVYYVMEYLKGGSLDDYIGRKGHLTETESRRLTEQIGSALSYMHSGKMLHLDMKPSNVMMNKNGDAVLIDFGLSKQYDEQGVPESSTTIGGGTPGYAPVEQSEYQEGQGFPVTMDVYALGGTMFKMLTGMRPPIASDIMNDGFPADELKKNGVSEKTVRIVAKAMDFRKKHRYQTVRDFLAAFEADDKGPVPETTRKNSPADDETIIDEQPKPKKKPEPAPAPNAPAEPQTKKSRKKKIGWGIGIAGVTVAVLLAILLLRHETTDFTKNIYSYPMVKVEGGTFTMGDNRQNADDEDCPPHTVTVGDFYIGQFEVSQGFWQAVMGDNPSSNEGLEQLPTDKTGGFPVESVSYEDVQEFIMRLNRRTGRNFSLPTEAQWEYAARGGTKAPDNCYYAAEDPLHPRSDIWYKRDHHTTVENDESGAVVNALGLCHMSGNVAEWCRDYYDENFYYNSNGEYNPMNTQPGEYNARVIRGGGYDDEDPAYVTIFSRYSADQTYRMSGVGFRLVINDN